MYFRNVANRLTTRVVGFSTLRRASRDDSESTRGSNFLATATHEELRAARCHCTLWTIEFHGRDRATRGEICRQESWVIISPYKPCSSSFVHHTWLVRILVSKTRLWKKKNYPSSTCRRLVIEPSIIFGAIGTRYQWTRKLEIGHIAYSATFYDNDSLCKYNV